MKDNPFIKSCPKCEGDMYKDCNSDETEWFWCCECCGYIEGVMPDA